MRSPAARLCSRYTQQGLDEVAAAARLGWIAPALLVLTALPLLLGFGV